MILRRLSAHVKAQNWFAVALDFVIVVAGVFIGMQVSNWNAARAEQRRADELFGRLVEDIKSERQSVSAAVAYYRTTIDYAQTALRGFETPGAVDPETFVVSAYQASQWLAPATSRSTFEELVSTGTLNLVRDQDVRAKLISYFEFNWTSNTTAATRPAYREAMRGVMPFALQKAIVTACGDREDRAGRTVLISLPANCAIDVPASELERAAAALRAAPGLEQALRYQLAENDSKVGSFLSVQNQLDDLIAAIVEPAP